MRIHKYRAWHKELKRMVWVFLIDFKTKQAEVGFRCALSEKECYPFRVSLHEIVLLEYTNLKDKNGVEIYEGDIIDTGGTKPVEVVFRKGHFAIKDDLSEKIGDCPLIFGLGGVVVGNIYENSNLLK